METNHQYERYLKARNKVQEIKGFYGHLIPFVIVNLFLLYTNLKHSPEYLWFFWPLLSWGIGLFFHAMKVFNFIPFLNKDWEEKKLRYFIEQEKSKTKNNEYK